MSMKKKLSQLPSVDVLLEQEEIKIWQENYTRELVKEQIKIVQDDIRANLLNDVDQDVSIEAVSQRVVNFLSKGIKSSLVPTINATGTVLHTNLGRALLAEEALEEMQVAGESFSNLEYDIEKGKRGSRYVHIQNILRELTGAEDALVVNNNAAAVLLILTTFAQGKEVLISRGELVEIGGSFRIPDVIESTGAILHEVGSTNKTHIKDYESGINEETAALIRVHTSNYRLIGFTETVSDEDFVKLAHDRNLPAFNDLGSGLLIDLQKIGLSYEPTVGEMIDANYDLVSFSGDKLLGGPQAGIIVGKKSYIEQLKSSPLLRALRTDKATIAALEATLRLYLNPEKAIEKIPTLKMINLSQEDCAKKAQELKNKIEARDSEFKLKIEQGYSQVGGGAYPGEQLPTSLLRIEHPKCNESRLERELRLSNNHIIARIDDGAVYFDLRTLFDEDYDAIVEALIQAVNNL